MDSNHLQRLKELKAKAKASLTDNEKKEMKAIEEYAESLEPKAEEKVEEPKKGKK